MGRRWQKRHKALSNNDLEEKGVKSVGDSNHGRNLDKDRKAFKWMGFGIEFVGVLEANSGRWSSGSVVGNQILVERLHITKIDRIEWKTIEFREVSYLYCWVETDLRIKCKYKKSDSDSYEFKNVDYESMKTFSAVKNGQ